MSSAATGLLEDGTTHDYGADEGGKCLVGESGAVVAAI